MLLTVTAKLELVLMRLGFGMNVKWNRPDLFKLFASTKFQKTDCHLVNKNVQILDDDAPSLLVATIASATREATSATPTNSGEPQLGLVASFPPQLLPAPLVPSPSPQKIILTRNPISPLNFRSTPVLHRDAHHNRQNASRNRRYQEGTTRLYAPSKFCRI